MKVEVTNNQKPKLQHDRGAERAAALQLENTFCRDAALEQDNLQWTGESKLLKPEEIIVLDEKRGSNLTDSITRHCW
jgi:hypothetical protein